MKLKGVAGGVWQVIMSAAVKLHMILMEKVQAEAASANGRESPTCGLMHSESL